MRKYYVLAVEVVCLLFAVWAVAQTSAGTQNNPAATTTTTTTTTTNQTTTSGPQRTVEGCVVKEASDYFLIPRSGNPIELQASTGEDLSAHEGHKVKVQGVESAMTGGSAAGAGTMGGTAGAATNAPASSSQAQSSGASSAMSSQAGSGQAASGAATGTGNDLHRLANRQMSIVRVTHVAETCPVNWNPNIATQKK